jgi:2-phospho-L-lactate guanylyltransferase
MSCWALVALKTTAVAKGRLAETLSLEERSRLVGRMFEQVLAALREARQIDGIAVVTGEPLAVVDVWRIDDPGGGLNAALTHGAAELASRGATELLVLHADLPLVRAEDIDAVVTAGRKLGLALAPDKLGQGSNALFVPLPLSFPFRFGIGSFALHLAEATRLGLEVARVERPRLACDIDEPADLVSLLAAAETGYEFLEAAVRRLRAGQEVG